MYAPFVQVRTRLRNISYINDHTVYMLRNTKGWTSPNKLFLSFCSLYTQKNKQDNAQLFFRGGLSASERVYTLEDT